MCGIVGELRLRSSREGLPDLEFLGQALGRVARRGPDHCGVYVDGPLAFGHQRLAIIDLSAQSNQPMVDAELGLALVFNGTIYNYPELRQHLQAKGYHFFSQGDSEVILKAYHAWGEAGIARLHGMFALAIWDVKAQQLLLARDRLGIKPLYVAQGPKTFRFASSLQALLADPTVDRSIDPVALHHQLTLHAVVPAPRTILAGVRKLAPAHTLRIDVNGVQPPRRYWTLTAKRPAETRTEIEWIELMHHSLKRAVERRLRIADVPVGVLLSGGLDSSLLVGLLAEAGVEDIRTYTVGFEDQPEEKGEEFAYSDAVVQRFNTRHHQYRIANAEVMTRLPEAVAQMAEPMVGQDAVAFYLLAEQVAQDIKVVQTGQGADEVFGGYFWYPRMATESGEPVERFARHYFDRSHGEYLAMVAPEFAGADYTRALIAAHLAEPGAQTFLDAVLRLDVTTLIVDDPVKRVDNMTMAWGLEARVPFLDHELVELAMQMPPELKLKAQGKYPLKQIARGLVPDSVIDRPKGYFPVPALKYVRGSFLELMREVLNATACRDRGLFQRAYVERLLSAPEAHLTPLQGSKLWHLALLELWLQLVVDKR